MDNDRKAERAYRDYQQEQDNKHRLHLLKELRSEWMDDRDQYAYGSPQWLGKHQGVYALDEAIKTLEAGEVKRYKDEGITIP